MPPRLVTPPAEEPVTLAEVKLQLHLDSTIEDNLVSSFLKTARERCETEVDRAFITSTWDLPIDSFPSTTLLPYTSPYRELWMLGHRGGIAIPNPPLQSVTSLTYVDVAGVTQTLAAPTYQVVIGPPAMVVPVYGTSWPSYRLQPESIVLRYVAGYGPASAVPEVVKTAIRMFAVHLFENRGEVDVPMPSVVKALLASAKWGSYQ